MPLYEFACRECGQPFEKLVRSANAIDAVTCPTCGSPEVKKKLSSFAATVGSGSGSWSANTACSTGGT
jgi:putative FmdB family regulatory protein